MQDRIERAFSGAQANIFLACEYLEDLISEYQRSDLDPVQRAGRISAIRAKQEYLKGLKFDPDAYPWVEDK